MDRKIKTALEMIIRVLGLVNGSITIHARGGRLGRNVEIITHLDV